MSYSFDTREPLRVSIVDLKANTALMSEQYTGNTFKQIKVVYTSTFPDALALSKSDKQDLYIVSSRPLEDKNMPCIPSSFANTIRENTLNFGLNPLLFLLDYNLGECNKNRALAKQQSFDGNILVPRKDTFHDSFSVIKSLLQSPYLAVACREEGQNRQDLLKSLHGDYSFFQPF